MKNIVQVRQLFLVISFKKKSESRKIAIACANTLYKKGMQGTSCSSLYMKLFDEFEAIADLQQDKQTLTIFFTHLLC